MYLYEFMHSFSFLCLFIVIPLYLFGICCFSNYKVTIKILKGRAELITKFIILFFF